MSDSEITGSGIHLEIQEMYEEPDQSLFSAPATHIMQEAQNISHPFASRCSMEIILFVYFCIILLLAVVFLFAIFFIDPIKGSVLIFPVLWAGFQVFLWKTLHRAQKIKTNVELDLATVCLRIHYILVIIPPILDWIDFLPPEEGMSLFKLVSLGPLLFYYLMEWNKISIVFSLIINIVLPLFSLLKIELIKDHPRTHNRSSNIGE